MTATARPLTDPGAPADVLLVDVACRACGGRLREINAGRSDGVRATWVGKCCVCGHEVAVVVELRAITRKAVA